MASALVFRWAAQIFVASVFTTGLMMMYLSQSQTNEPFQEAMQQRKAEVKNQLRLQKLRELQKTIFLDPDRPPDKVYNINVTLSEHIPLERDIPDPRPEDCKKIQYDKTRLPKLSVIIPFYNEALSMLLRTVHSIIMRTPPDILQEIILVDDNSPNGDLQKPLEKYIKYLPQVQLIRLPKREGLIRARIIGAKIAMGPVLMFQDAHMENNVGWAEPLLEEIRKNRKVIIQPSVDQIDQWTMEYTGSHGAVPRGGFSWDMRYVWMQMPKHESRRLKSEAQPHRTPTLVGCAMALDKEYFFSIGSFDDGMNIWGGENIELGFRNWMCGGEVLTHPCSRVAHTFKPFPYQFDGDREKIVQKNQMRIAELWMDDYKKFFYAATYTWPNKRVAFTEEDLVTLENRRKIRERLQCHDFEWYMKTIVPEIPTPPVDAVYYGEVANMKSEACWYVTTDGYIGLTYFCFFHRVLPENLFHIDQLGRLWYRTMCVRIDYSTWLLRLGDCLADPDNEHWDVESLSIKYGVPNEVKTTVTIWDKDKNARQKMCVTHISNVNPTHKGEQMPQVTDCDGGNQYQKWRWSYKLDFNYNFDEPLR